MKVYLVLRGPLKKYGRTEQINSLDLEQNKTTAKDALEQLNIPLSAVSFVLINGEKKGLKTVLQEGDEITVNPKVAGG